MPVFRSSVPRGVRGNCPLSLAGERVPVIGNVGEATITRIVLVVTPTPILSRLSNDKPSAIFRLRGTFASGASSGPVAFAGDANPTVGGDVTAILGIAIEPLSQIAPALPDPGITNGSGTVVAATRAADPGHLAEQVVKHLFNFISSFVASGAVDEHTLVPMSAIVRWYEGFKTKLKNMGPGFLDRATD